MPSIRRCLYEDSSDDTAENEDSEDDDNHGRLFVVVPSLASCFVDGIIDLERVLKRRRLLNKREMADDDDDEYFSVMNETPTKKMRRPKAPILARKTEDGELEEIMPTESLWYIIYIANPNTECKRERGCFLPDIVLVDQTAVVWGGSRK